MQKISSFKIGLLTVCSVILMSSCSTYQNLATQWKYRNDYKNPGFTASTSKVKTVENFTPSIDIKEDVSNQTAEINALASTESTSEVLAKMPEVLINKREISHAEVSKTSSKEIKLTKKQVKAEIKALNKGIKAENTTTQAQGGKSQTTAFVMALLSWLILCSIIPVHRFYLGGSKNTKNGIWMIVLGILSLGFVTVIWGLIDWIRIATGSLKPGSGDYNPKW